MQTQDNNGNTSNINHYEQIADEISHDSVVRHLWDRAVAESGGDKEKVQSAYTRYRIDELKGYSTGSSKNQVLTDDELYECIATELEQNSLRQGLWAKAFAEADGDKSKAQAIYIRYRFAELKKLSPAANTLSGSSTYGPLRFIRGFFGFIFAWQVFGLLPVVTWLQQPDAVTGEMWAQVTIKIIVLALSGWLFFWFRSLINYFHTRKHGVPHPILAKRVWAL